MKPKSNTSYYLAVLIMTFSLIGCEKQDESLEVKNLLKNNSFEFNNIGSMEDWKVMLDYNNTSSGFLADTTPINGGVYSLGLYSLYSRNGTLESISSCGYAETSITGLSGENIFEVSAWVLGAEGASILSLVQKRNGVEISEKRYSSGSNGWMKFQFQDTLTLEETDILIIGLEKVRGHTVGKETAFFDMIELIIIE